MRACCRGLSAEYLGDDCGDVDPLIDRAPHAEILERVASLDVGEFELRAALIEAEILGADVGHLGELEALLLLQARDVLERRGAYESDPAPNQRPAPRGGPRDPATQRTPAL